VVVFGLIGLLMMFYAPPFLLSWLGILGTGTLLAALVGPIFLSAFWRGNAWGALAAMLGGVVTSGGLLLWSDVGWVVGPLIGCLVSTLLYVLVSLTTRARAPRVRST
jgi:Na+/pantothenate symporter